MLIWNVYIGNFSNQKIEKHNVFNHKRFLNDCINNVKHNKDKDSFAKQLKKDLMYYYWSKCEWEVIVSGWPPKKDFNEIKIDVFDQIYLNWDRFVDYVWENRKDIKEENYIMIG